MPTLTAARNAVGLSSSSTGWSSPAGSRASRGRGRARPDQRPARPACCSRSPSARSWPCRPRAPPINASGTVRVVRIGAPRPPSGMLAAAVGLGNVLAVTVVGLLVYGLGIGVWDVAMNVEGAEVERGLGPHDHAALPRRLQRRHGRRRAARRAAGRAGRAGRRAPRRRRGAGARAGVAHLAGVPAGRRAPRGRASAVGGPGLAGAAHAADRRDGAGLRDDRGHRQRLARGRAGRRARRLALGRRGRLRRLRARDDGRPVRRHRAHRPVRPGGRAVGDHGAGRRRRAADRVRRHPALVVAGIVLWGVGASLGFPVGHERRGRRPGPGRLAGQRRLDDRLRRVPRRAAAARLRRRPGRHAQGAARRRRAADAGGAGRAGGPGAARRATPSARLRAPRARRRSRGSRGGRG